MLKAEQMTTLERKIEHFSRILAGRPGDELTILALAEASFRRGLKLEALTAYQDVVSGRPLPEAHLAVAEIYSAQGMPHEAYDELRRLFALDPENVEARLLVNALQEDVLPPVDIAAIMEAPASDEAFDEARLRLRIQRSIYNRELQERTRNVTLEPGTVIHEYHMEEAKKKLIRVDELLRELEKFQEYSAGLSLVPRGEMVSAQTDDEVNRHIEAGDQEFGDATGMPPVDVSDSFAFQTSDLGSLEDGGLTQQDHPGQHDELNETTVDGPVVSQSEDSEESGQVTYPSLEDHGASPEHVDSAEPAPVVDELPAEMVLSDDTELSAGLLEPHAGSSWDSGDEKGELDEAARSLDNETSFSISPLSDSHDEPSSVQHAEFETEESLPSNPDIDSAHGLESSEVATSEVGLVEDEMSTAAVDDDSASEIGQEMPSISNASIEQHAQSHFTPDFDLSVESPLAPDLPDLGSDDDLADEGDPSLEIVDLAPIEMGGHDDAVNEDAFRDLTPALKFPQPTFDDAPVLPDPVRPAAVMVDESTMILAPPEPDFLSRPPVVIPDSSEQNPPLVATPVYASVGQEVSKGISDARKAFYDTHAETLSSLTTTLARTRGVTSIYLAAREGVTIDSVAKDEISEKRIGELVKESFEFLEAFAAEPAYWVLECAGGIFVMQKLDARHVLIAIGQAGANFGALRYTMDKTKTKFEQLLSQAPA